MYQPKCGYHLQAMQTLPIPVNKPNHGTQTTVQDKYENTGGISLGSLIFRPNAEQIPREYRKDKDLGSVAKIDNLVDSSCQRRSWFRCITVRNTVWISFHRFRCPRSVLAHDDSSRVQKPLSLELFAYFHQKAVDTKRAWPRICFTDGTAPLVSGGRVTLSWSRFEKCVEVEALIVKTCFASDRSVADFRSAEWVAQVDSEGALHQNDFIIISSAGRKLTLDVADHGLSGNSLLSTALLDGMSRHDAKILNRNQVVAVGVVVRIAHD